MKIIAIVFVICRNGCIMNLLDSFYFSKQTWNALTKEWHWDLQYTNLPCGRSNLTGCCLKNIFFLS